MAIFLLDISFIKRCTSALFSLYIKNESFAIYDLGNSRACARIWRNRCERNVVEHTCPNKIFSGLIQPISSRVGCETHHFLSRNAR